MTKLETTYYTKAHQIPDEVFVNLGCASSFYFEKYFLEAFAKANPSIEHRYLIIHSNQNPQALVVIQQLNVAIEGAPQKLSLQNKAARALQGYLNNKEVAIALCGNLFLSGNYGVYIKKGVPQTHIYGHIAQEMKSLKASKKASVFFLKDFTQQELPMVEVVSKKQFQPFSVEPNMLLKLVWKDYDAYKNALRSKYRVKVNKADSLSESLVRKNMDSQSIEEHQDRLQELYHNITDRSFFTSVEMNMATYVLLKERFRESVILNTYWLHNKMVGFATAFKVGDKLEAHYVGMDYEYNKEFSIYPRILNDYVRMGFELGCTEVNFGRTASEIKSTLGAIPEDLICYVRHRRTAANLLFRPLIKHIKMTEYKQHWPFKEL